MKRIFASTALALSTLSFSIISSAAPTFQSQGEASFSLQSDGNNEYAITTETRYFHITYPESKLIKAAISNKTYINADGMNGKVALEVRVDDRARLDRVLWTATEEGNAVELTHDDFVGVLQYGCCAAPTITRLFNIETGKKVEAATGEIFSINVPNSKLKNRYLAPVIDSKAPTKLGNRSHIGTFSYFDANRIISRVRVYADLPAGWGADVSELKIVDLSGKTPGTQVQGQNVTLWGSDFVNDAKQGFTGFAIEGKSYYGNQEETVRIAIEGDAFSERSSFSTPGIVLQFVK